ncbi:hypothetical protein FOL47_000500 [Perkinsus chesapeaki]|uniref:Uncharacterized protein n=1 Tax=Perkinsus chesapeaki TaxID=330153 RepID=A0A7J6KVQ2_PERCH|nr:hypothetical protein FOL47_000500 [Perkinsus chesapeaki]
MSSPAPLHFTRHLLAVTATRVMMPLPPHLRSRIPAPPPPSADKPVINSTDEVQKNYTTPRSTRRPWEPATDPGSRSRAAPVTSWEQDTNGERRHGMTEGQLYEILTFVDPSCPGLKITPGEVASVLVNRVQRNVAQLIRRHIARICAHHAPCPKDDSAEGDDDSQASAPVSTEGLVPATPKELAAIMKSLGDVLVVKDICSNSQVLRAEEWSMDDIADFMSWCKIRFDHGVLPEVVRGFSDRVCDNLGDVSHRDIVRFASTVGDNSKCVDEFWMYIMAKRIQDDPSVFTTTELVSLITSYTDRSLEDDDLYASLTQELGKRFSELTNRQCADLMKGLANVRHRDEDLCVRILDTIVENIHTIPQEILVQILGSMSTLDLKEDRWIVPVWQQLDLAMAATPGDGSAGSPRCESFSDYFAVLQACCHLPHAGDGVYLNDLVRSLLSKRTSKALKRRLVQMVQCYQRGMVMADLPVLPELAEMLLSEESFDSMYFPVSSGFHLEVAAILRMMGCHYEIEDKVMPFILDVTMSAEEVARVNSEEAARDGIEREERANRVVEWLKSQGTNSSGMP